MGASPPIDHIVVVVRDLSSAARSYEALGFTLTPTAIHPDGMGTRNRLAQFAGNNFIELLEVDRPEKLDDHDLAARPPRFSFGAHHRAFGAGREGMSMLVFASGDARADMAVLAGRGVTTYAPFDFERRATLPDGTAVTVAFTLGYATDPAMPMAAFAFCHNRFPQHFWKPAFQAHRNGARGISTVYLAAEDPARHEEFLRRLSGRRAHAIEGGLRVPCGRSQHLVVLTPDAARQICPTIPVQSGGTPSFVGVGIAAARTARSVVSPRDACGIFIEWIPE